VLSLRLLGRLDEELSCANSRFFRTTLYANARVADVLRTQFVLHWQSVRPAPKLTIDFGDGRKMVTTVTGNSIHYVLDEKGNVVDALPGLYSPATFVARLSADAKLAQVGLEDRQGAWSAALTAAAVPGNAARPNRDAVAAGRLAVSKSMVQSTAVRTITGNPFVTLPPAVPEAAIQAITFDAPSLALMRRKMPDEWSAEAVDAALSNLRRTIAQDEVLNDMRLRPAILRHLSMNPTEPVAALNDWVYANVFLTPGDDKWLGLANADRFNGIENGGLAVESHTP
ncbi:MAG: hypothetical protein JWM57_3032, partial [Phycisphaerales bacterium]|nr:hypothetical protein [Phycisphaerales bacterium]